MTKQNNQDGERTQLVTTVEYVDGLNLQIDRLKKALRQFDFSFDAVCNDKSYQAALGMFVKAKRNARVALEEA